jgi:transposase
VPDPGLSDLFGKAGRRYLASASVPETERLLLERQLAHLDFLESQRHELETLLATALKPTPRLQYLQSIPGIGTTLAAVIALEIETIDRFPDAAHLAAYADLVPSLHASGGTAHPGPLLRACNRLLKWAFIEAAWKAQTCSAYCRAYFQARRQRLGPNPAVVALARRLVHIAYAVLKEQRPYEERPVCPRRPRVRLAV